MVGGVSLADRCYMGHLLDSPASVGVICVAEAIDGARGTDWVGCY